MNSTNESYHSVRRRYAGLLLWLNHYSSSIIAIFTHRKYKTIKILWFMIMITVNRARRVEQYKCEKLWMDHHLPIQTIYGLIIRHLSSQLTLANETEAWIRHTDCVEPNIIAAQPKFRWKMTSFCGKLIAIRLYFVLKNMSLYVCPRLPCPGTCRIWKSRSLMFWVNIVFLPCMYTVKQVNWSVLCCLHYLKHQCRSCATPLNQFELRTS